jgi:hypothetical protein
MRLGECQTDGDHTGPERDEDIPRTNQPKNSTFELNPVPINLNLSCIHLLKNTCEISWQCKGIIGFEPQVAGRSFLVYPDRRWIKPIRLKIQVVRFLTSAG